MSLLSKRASEEFKCIVIIQFNSIQFILCHIGYHKYMRIHKYYMDQDANPLVNTISDENILIPYWRTNPKKQLVEMYPDMFNAELGLVPGKYHIRLKGEKAPVKHAPRNVPCTI